VLHVRVLMPTRRSVVAACAAVGVLWLTSPSDATAGAYTVAQCHQSINPSQSEAIPERTSEGYSLVSECSGGPGLGVLHGFGDITGFGDYGRWGWRAPPGTVFSVIEATTSLVGGASEEPALTAVQEDGQAVSFAAGGAAWGPPGRANGQFSELWVGLRCGAAGGCLATSPSASATVTDVLLTVNDREAPQASIYGPLLEALAVRGDLTFGMRVADAGGGIREWDLQANGVAVSGDTLDCQIAAAYATALQPCAGEATETVALDTSTPPFATGNNRLTACGADLALDGLANHGCASDVVFVDDVCPESPIGTGTRLSATFAHGKRRSVGSSEHRRRINGKLESDTGEGIAGATICALTHTRREGAPYVIADTARTRGTGAYSLLLPGGPSRKVYVHAVVDDSVLAVHGLAADSTVRPTFVIRPGADGPPLTTGDRLRFRGRLPGPSCRKRVVKVQAKVGKRRWQVFRAVRTNAHCRYEARYKLRATERPVRYRFRVRVPAQAGYPYRSGVSAVLKRAAR
jgi:hypothetical protein